MTRLNWGEISMIILCLFLIFAFGIRFISNQSNDRKMRTIGYALTIIAMGVMVVSAFFLGTGRPAPMFQLVDGDEYAIRVVQEVNSSFETPCLVWPKQGGTMQYMLVNP